MTGEKKELYIVSLLCILCLFVYALQLNGYPLMEAFLEAKYVASASNLFDLTDIFSPQLNGS